MKYRHSFCAKSKTFLKTLRSFSPWEPTPPEKIIALDHCFPFTSIFANASTHGDISRFMCCLLTSYKYPAICVRFVYD